MMGLVAVAVEGVGIVGNFGVGRKLGWECCGDVISDEGKILSGEV